MRLLVFGYGFTGRALARRLRPRGWEVAATFRGDPASLEADGVAAVPLEPDALGRAAAADAVLITAPPGPEGCPGLAALAAALARARPGWVGYLSTTGVYGDRAGGWVTERSPVAAQSVEGARRAACEHDWQATGLPVHVFRLPGIYGPGRSAFDRLREGKARRIVSPGQVFSRIHVEDLAAGLEASLTRPRPGAVALLGMEPPPEVPLAEANLPPAAMRFYAESKRVANALAKAELSWRPAYPTYREGLAAILASA